MHDPVCNRWTSVELTERKLITLRNLNSSSEGDFNFEGEWLNYSINAYQEVFAKRPTKCSFLKICLRELENYSMSDLNDIFFFINYSLLNYLQLYIQENHTSLKEFHFLFLWNIFEYSRLFIYWTEVWNF